MEQKWTNTAEGEGAGEDGNHCPESVSFSLAVFSRLMHGKFESEGAQKHCSKY